jgi:8-oxo-dGTP diphosphatase
VIAAPAEVAAAFIVDDRGRVLIVRQNYGKRLYSLPGGAVEKGETPEDAAVREVEEETGVCVRINDLVGRYWIETKYVAYVFRCGIINGTPACPDTGELAEVEWYRPSGIPSPMTNSLHYSLSDALNGSRGVVRPNLRDITDDSVERPRHT